MVDTKAAVAEAVDGRSTDVFDCVRGKITPFRLPTHNNVPCVTALPTSWIA